MALSTEEVLAGLAELINDETGIATDSVALDKSFTDDLDIDSISMMTIEFMKCPVPSWRTSSFCSTWIRVGSSLPP